MAALTIASALSPIVDAYGVGREIVQRLLMLWMQRKKSVTQVLIKKRGYWLLLNHS